MIYKALTVAGSDSGGCAGIQADIKTFSALGVFGMSAITALTAQNTLGVTDVHPVPAINIAAQIDAVMSDIGAGAVKTGMLFSAEIIKTVIKSLKRWGVDNLVVDPVMVATTGAVLLQSDARETMMEELFPLAKVITPNLPEAELITGMEITSESDKKEVCKKMTGMGARSVLLKGGHRASVKPEKATDLWYDGERFIEFSAPWVDTNNLHGTGWTYSAAIASYLARGCALEESIRLAKDYIANAIAYGAKMSVGKGNGPVGHFYKYERV